MSGTDQTNDQPSTESDDVDEVAASGDDDGEAWEINDAADRTEKRAEELEDRFDEEDQGEAWNINANTAGRDD